MYGGCYEDRGGANGNRERESKHCDCCYCEFFGHGGVSIRVVGLGLREWLVGLTIQGLGVTAATVNSLATAG